jgi:uncharacterized protein
VIQGRIVIETFARRPVMTTRSTLFAFASFAVTAVLAGPGQAASFDCAKAATPTEHAICDNPQLSHLDDQMAGMYYTLISNGSLTQAQVNQVKNEQVNWLAKRNACGANYNCLISAYTDQIMYLKATAGQGM